MNVKLAVNLQVQNTKRKVKHVSHFDNTVSFSWFISYPRLLRCT